MQPRILSAKAPSRQLRLAVPREGNWWTTCVSRSVMRSTTDDHSVLGDRSSRRKFDSSAGSALAKGESKTSYRMGTAAWPMAGFFDYKTGAHAVILSRVNTDGPRRSSERQDPSVEKRGAAGSPAWAQGKMTYGSQAHATYEVRCVMSSDVKSAGFPPCENYGNDPRIWAKSARHKVAGTSQSRSCRDDGAFRHWWLPPINVKKTALRNNGPTPNRTVSSGTE